MTKIIITADMHFGVPNKHDDIMWAANTVAHYADSNDIDTIIVLGDLCHDRKHIELNVACDIYKFFKLTKDMGQQWIVFPGNHDMYMRHSWEVNSILPFSDHLIFLDGIKGIEIDNQRFWTLPFIQLESAYMQVVNKLNSQANSNDILLTHIGVNKALMNVCFLLSEWNMVNFEETNFKRIYTGHFHCTQQIGNNVWYPGSQIPLKSDEGDVDHGFFVYDTQLGEHTFVSIWDANKTVDVPAPSTGIPPQYITITDESVGNIDHEILKGNIIKVTLSRSYSREEIASIEKKLKNSGARDVRTILLDTNDYSTVANLHKAIKPKDIFNAFIENDKRGTTGLMIPLLRKLVDEVIIEGDNNYFIENGLPEES